MKHTHAVGLLAALCCATNVQAQKLWHKPEAVAPEVYQERIVAVFPPLYFGTPRPDPPVAGFYAWKIVFGDADAITVVFRTDSAVAATSDRSMMRGGALYLCESPQQPALECTTRLRGSARSTKDFVEIEITDPQVVAWVRQRRPEVAMRQQFEPGGRFHVDPAIVVYREHKSVGKQ